MSALDELAGVLAGVVNGPKDGTPITRRMAAAAFAADYSKPRTINTLGDLEALTLPAILDCKNGGTAKVEYMYGPGRQKYAEFLFGEADESHTLAELAEWALPAQILKEGAQ